MASYYSVVRFVPSALAEEFVNIGVLVFGDGQVRGKFLEDWGRVERFAEGHDVRHAREFQEWVIGSMVPEGPSDLRVKKILEADVCRIAHEWTGSVQLTEPRASLLGPEALLEDVAPTFLVDANTTEQEPEVLARRSSDHHKSRIVRATVESLRNQIAHHPQMAALTVKTRHPLSANVRPRVFDVVIANGVPKHAVQCFNFYVADTKKVLDQVDAAAFAIEDVRKKLPGFSVSVVASLPQRDAAFEQATSTFDAVGVEVVIDAQIGEWSEKIIAQLGTKDDGVVGPLN